MIGPRFWFKSPLGGKLNIRLLLRGPDGGYNFRGHSNSNGGHGDAELKQPGTASSERSFRPLSTTWSQKKILTNYFQHFQNKFQDFRADIQFLITRFFSKTINLCSSRFFVKTSNFSLEFLQIFTKKYFSSLFQIEIVSSICCQETRIFAFVYFCTHFPLQITDFLIKIIRKMSYSNSYHKDFRKKNCCSDQNGRNSMEI